jgi:iron complex outermembrane receptor protein
MARQSNRRALRVHTIGKRTLVGCIAWLTAAAGGWNQASAQEETPAPARQAPAEQASPEDAKLEQVVVTGSRIARAGFEAPTPVSVIGAERLEQRAATNIGDLLNELPAFRPTQTPASGGLGTGTGGYFGGRVLDLRGLGPVRTLVLVDGKRFTPSTPQSTVDTNMIPGILLERAEVVTGGASAAYGSDAVAGVVNFILDERLDGIKSNIEYGESQRQDNKTKAASIAAGAALWGGRGHIIGAVEYENNSGVGTCTVREWCAEEWLNFGNPVLGAGGLPANNILPHIRPSTISAVGVINSSFSGGKTSAATSPLHGIAFNPDGTPRPFVYGSLVNSLYMTGGEGEGHDGYFEGIPIVSPTDRYTVYSRLKFDFTDDLQGRFDVSFGHLRAHHDGTEYRSTGLTITADNPFIPTSPDPTLNIPAIMAANNITSFTLGKNFEDIGNPQITSTNSLVRAVASLKGKLGGSWTWDAYYQFGRNDFESDTGNVIMNANIAKALSSVRNGTGQIVCRVNADATAANDDPACVPLNPFGMQVSPAARNYLTGTSVQTAVTHESVAAANIQGEPLSLWAGPLSFAGGAEYRNDETDGTADPVSRSLGFFTNNAADNSGRIAVTEGYLETDAPLLQDLPLARQLNFNGAVRRTHYDRNGSAGSSDVNTTTWKYGLVWEPVQMLRLRATKSRDIRAPNVSELFGPNTTAFSILTDPKNGVQTNPVVVSGSNAALVPEVASTWTAGFVIQPTGDGWYSRLQTSVDYYDINIANSIGNLGAQTIATRCQNGATEFCALITRDPTTGVITRVNDVLLNVNQQITRGLDMELDYHQPMGAYGATNFRILATYVFDLITVDSAGPVNRAGQTGLRATTIPGIPRYTLDTLINWVDKALSISLHGRFIPAGIYNAAFVGPEQSGYDIKLTNSSNTNHVKSATYLDLVAEYRFDASKWGALSVYGGLNNLLDTDPPRVPGANGTGNNLLFDPVGRNFKLGVRYQL